VTRGRGGAFLGALATDFCSVALTGELAAMLHQEALGATELVGHHRYDCPCEFLVDQISPGLAVKGSLLLVDVDSRRP
jgi:hypothetical protein